MRHKDYCSRCKSKDNPLVKHVKVNGVQYYYCRPCHASRIKKYARLAKVNFPEKQKARLLLGKKVRAGTIRKPPACENCGAGERLEGHHTDYFKPLEVIWLCRPCHSNLPRF